MAVDAAPCGSRLLDHDTGGGQATAYIVFEPVAMVDKSVNFASKDVTLILSV